MLGQRRRRWTDVVQMLYKCFAFDRYTHLERIKCFIVYNTTSGGTSSRMGQLEKSYIKTVVHERSGGHFGFSQIRYPSNNWNVWDFFIYDSELIDEINNTFCNFRRALQILTAWTTTVLFFHAIAREKNDFYSLTFIIKWIYVDCSSCKSLTIWRHAG